MCGKFTQMASWRQVVDFSQPLETGGERPLSLTPMAAAAVIYLDADGRRATAPMSWAFTDRRKSGQRRPKHFHARGETIDKVFAGGFRFRRGLLLVRTFNEGEEVPVRYADGAPAGRTWTRQWTVKPSDGRPLAIGVIFDVFEQDRGPECEFVMVTTVANRLISRITDRMPLIVRPRDWGLWLGETRAPLLDVKALIQTFEDDGAWEMTVEDPARQPPRPRNPSSSGAQGELF
jgi:putative SOS response-associated peptidase YedK